MAASAPDDDAVRLELERGRRLDAADCAEREAKTATPERLRELLGILARELREIGDRHHRVGRPLMRFNMRRQFPLMMASHDLTRAVIARCILNGDKIGPESLAMFLYFAGLLLASESESTEVEVLLASRAELFRQDPAITAAALEDVRPYAESVLRAMALEPTRIKRQGFRAEYRRRLIAEHRVVIGAEKIKPPKVRE